MSKTIEMVQKSTEECLPLHFPHSEIKLLKIILVNKTTLFTSRKTHSLNKVKIGESMNEC
jgi:hypothetical protein